MMNASNLTAEEFYRLNGTLDAPRIEKLLVLEEQAEHIESALTHIDEAKAQLPDEDFLEPVLDLLNPLLKRLRGDKREALKEAIEKLTEVQSSISRYSEYAMFELKRAIDQLEKCE